MVARLLYDLGQVPGAESLVTIGYELSDFNAFVE
jgi:hypothetical protein